MGTTKTNPLLYPQSRLPFSTDLFQNPSSEYRGSPFWSWNASLEPERLKRQIDYFQKMGFGGFHMHSRVGLDTPYMGPEFMDCVKECVGYAKKQVSLPELPRVGMNFKGDWAESIGHVGVLVR